MYKNTVVKDIINECEVRPIKVRGSFYNGVMYKDICLWTTIYNNLEDCEIYLEKYEEEDFSEYSIKGKTPILGYDDYEISLYGSWDNEEDALKWLENPKSIY